MSPAAMYSLARLTIASNAGCVMFGVQRHTVAARGTLERQRALELAFEEFDLGAGKLIERAEVLVARDPRVGDQQDAMLHVIEGEHRVEQHEAGIIAVGAARRRLVRATVGSNHAAVS